MKNDNI